MQMPPLVIRCIRFLYAVHTDHSVNRKDNHEYRHKVHRQ